VKQNDAAQTAGGFGPAERGRKRRRAQAGKRGEDFVGGGASGKTEDWLDGDARGGVGARGLSPWPFKVVESARKEFRRAQAKNGGSEAKPRMILKGWRLGTNPSGNQKVAMFLLSQPAAWLGRYREREAGCINRHPVKEAGDHEKRAAGRTSSETLARWATAPGTRPAVAVFESGGHHA